MLYHLLLIGYIISNMRYCNGLQNTTNSSPVLTGNASSINTTFGGAVGEGIIDLYILGLWPMGGPWAGGQGLLPAALLALDHVNDNSHILNGYRLNMIWNDTQCNTGIGTNLMYSLLYEPPVKQMIMGPHCSNVCETTAQASHLWNLVHVSSCASYALSNRDKYPGFFRVIYPDTVWNPSRVALMMHYGWNRIATIHQSYQLFSAVTDDIVERFKQNNISLITSEIFREDPAPQVRNLKKQDARIIVAGFYQDMAPKVFCEAYRIGLYGPKYVWILPGWFSNDWYEESSHLSDCTKQQVMTAANGYLTSVRVVQNPGDDISVAGFTSSQLYEQYQTLIGWDGRYGSEFAPWGYDSIWAAAIALNRTIHQLKLMGTGLKIEDFSYDRVIGDVILASMKETGFMGMKGPVYFDESGGSMSLITTKKWTNGTLEEFVIFHPERVEGAQLEWLPLADNIWKENGGEVPLDSTTVIFQTGRISLALYVTAVSFAALGILLALFFLAFNISFRNEKMIKMSSPNMNNVILMGCILVYAAVFMKEVDANNTTVFCQTRTILIMVGFSMTFGALFSKTWRVHKIYTSKLKKVLLRDFQLLGVVFVLVSVDIIIFVLRESLDPQKSTIEEKSIEVKDDGDTLVHHQVELCTSRFNFYFLVVVYSIKGLLLAFGTFLAWETRKVSIPALNDSHNIGMCIYNVVVLSVLGVILSFVLDSQPNLNYILTSALLIIGTTITQLMVFVPKIIKLHDIKIHGEESVTYVRGAWQNNSNIGTISGGMEHTQKDDKIRQLEATIRDMQNATQMPLLDC